MVIAKNQPAFTHLKRQFMGRHVKKEYTALAYGALPKDHDTIALKIARSKSRRRMVARPEGQEGKEAITEYDVVARYKTATLARVRTLTGRTHQIRAHFKGIDHPLVGDTLYAKRHMRHIKPIPLARIFLHAGKLTVPLPNGTIKTFESPLPKELGALLSNLQPLTSNLHSL
jgi:23S rRNA-/tRNA-specific pseudouridylate synthase